jgi:transcriptional regulator with XRE-family HTH domain
MQTALSSGGVPSPDRPAFAQVLRAWREARRCSQLQLAMEAGVSQRHVSFLELGRTAPSREMVLALCQALDLPLHDRNLMLQAAGYAPQFRRSALGDPAMKPVLAALDAMVSALDSHPLVVVDGAWRVVRTNAAMQRLLAALAFGPDVLAAEAGKIVSANLMKALFHPRALRTRIENWTSIAPLMLAHLRRQFQTTSRAEVSALLAEVIAYPDVASLMSPRGLSGDLPPITPVIFAHGGFRVELMSICSMLGAAQDMTTDELRIMTFLAADDTAKRAIANIG